MSRSLADLLFRPRRVVVYGASSDPDKLSGRPLDYLKRFGYTGEICAVNPRRSRVQGIDAYDHVADVPRPVDLAIIVVPAASVIEALRCCAAVGVGAAIVFASGFAEIGEQGRELQTEIEAIVASSGMRVLGPNCLGSFSAEERAVATFSTAFDSDDELPDSPIGLVTQSGAVGTFTFTMMNALGLGVRYFANPGNSSDITVTEVLALLACEPDVHVLLGHVENFEDRGALERLARTADEASKPLVLLKAGRTPAGARAVDAHTASDPGDDALFDRVLGQHGVIRADSMEAMADTALGFVDGRQARGRRLTIVTFSGGAGALTADAAVEHGLVVEPWHGEDRERIAARLPYFASTANPIDLTGAIITDVGILAHALDIIVDNDDTDAVLVIVGNADSVATEMTETIEAAHRSTKKPFMVAWTGGSGMPRAALLKAGVPTYPDPRRAVAALSQVVGHSLRTCSRTHAH